MSGVAVTPRGRRVQVTRAEAVVVGAWLLVVMLGSAMLWRYKSTPGAASPAPATWPQGSHVARSPTRPTLIMFVHPRCPCSRASIGELATIISRANDRLDAHALFNRPSSETDDWTDTDLWRSAAAIPGVDVRVDVDGAEAARFGASTSGHVVLYDARGKLAFAGGITNARGHAGDSEGRRAVLAIVLQGGSKRADAPVFGCALDRPELAGTN